jgi:hypothetical protein
MTSVPTAGGAVAEPVRVRRLTDQEGQKLQQIVRRDSTGAVRYRRAMMLLASVGGNRVPVIAQLVQADEDTVRDVIHRFNEIGLAALDPQWAGGRPRLLSPDDEDFASCGVGASMPSRSIGTLTSKYPWRRCSKWVESPRINALNSVSAAEETGSANSITRVGPAMPGA